MNAWQPIKTAPKDGSWVWLSDGSKAEPAFWGPTYFGCDPEWIQYAHRSEAETITFIPIMWHPAPVLPQGDKEGGAE